MVGSQVGPQVTVVVGVDGAGRTHRLAEIAAATTRTVIRVNPIVATPQALATILAQAATGDQLVLVDDAHRLGATELRLLADAARGGLAVVVARRPSIDSRELADLDEAVATGGTVLQLAPLSVAGVATLISAVTGRATAPDIAQAVHTASGGLPAVVSALATVAPDSVAPALLARVQRKLAVLDPRIAGLARLLALRLTLSDRVLATAAQLDADRFSTAMRTLRDEGLLTPVGADGEDSGGDTMIPAVAIAILADLPAAERRRVHDLIAHAVIAEGGDPVVAATQLRAARAFVPAAAQTYRTVADRLRFVDPTAALGWYEDAIEAGVDPATVGIGRAESAVLVGLPVDLGQLQPTGEPGDSHRLALLDGAVESHQGRAIRAAEAFCATDQPGPVLAVAALVSIGRLDEVRAAGESPVALRRFADAAYAAIADPARAVPMFIEAAESVERMPPPLVLPDTPHALGAVVSAVAGDVASAEHLLDRAFAAGVGGPVAARRHHLLRAWVRMRSGRYDTAVAQLRHRDDPALPGRERLLLAALAAGIARRSGDVTRLRDAWASVEPVLARRTVDLFTVEMLEELAVAATRLRQEARMTAALEVVSDIVARLGCPPVWTIAVGWIRVQIAIATEDANGVMAAADLMAGVHTGLGARQLAQRRAAVSWGQVLRGEVDVDAVLACGSELADAELPWEGSRLVGQAAIRTSDASAARRLLERARELSSAEVVAADSQAEPQLAGLSEREVEVARMVLDGGTYREIGSRLFISPKTVEHHVARIRTKLGATTRAEFIATLRTVLGR